MITMIRSILSSVSEGVVKRFSGAGRSGETFTDRECFQHYGFTSRALAGAEGILLKQGNQIMLIASDDRRYRIKVEHGEVALYSDEGDYVHLKRGNLVEVKTSTLEVIADTKVILDTPLVEITGEVEADLHITSGGNITADGDIHDMAGGTGLTMSGMRSIYNRHAHPENDGGGPTDEPIPGDQM